MILFAFGSFAFREFSLAFRHAVVDVVGLRHGSRGRCCRRQEGSLVSFMLGQYVCVNIIGMIWGENNDGLFGSCTMLSVQLLQLLLA